MAEISPQEKIGGKVTGGDPFPQLYFIYVGRFSITYTFFFCLNALLVP